MDNEDADPLFGVYLKLERAYKHLCDLETEIDAFYKRKPYRVTVDMHTEPGTQIFKLAIQEDVSRAWAGPIGDIIHNLRSALDILAVALAIHNGRTSRSALSETYFPIGASKEVFQGKARKDLRYVADTARRIVERLKPYKGGTDAFWRLHQLDILDKHVLIIPVGATNAGVQMVPDIRHIVAGMQLPSDFIMPTVEPLTFVPKRRIYPLKQGQELLRFRRVRADGTVDPGEHDYKFAFDVAFGEGQIVDGEPLIPTLRQFIDFTERVVELFARHIFK